MNPAFFLDRDGTLNVDYNFVHQPEEWSWCEGAVDALQWIQNHGFKIIVLTNQSGIARGRYTLQQVQKLHTWVDDQLRDRQIKVDAWHVAPHHPVHDPDERFDPANRKPNTGMFEQAAERFNIDFSRSYMAGDKITDLKPAVELGIKPLFIRSRHASAQDKSWLKQHHIPSYNSLWEAVKNISAGQ